MDSGDSGAEVGGPSTPPAHRPTPPIAFARAIRADETVRALDADEARAWRPGVDGRLAWIHLEAGGGAVGPWLSDAIGASETVVEALVSDDDRPRAFREGDALLVVLRGPDNAPAADARETVDLRIWADDSRVVTVRSRPSPAVEAVLSRLDVQVAGLTAADLVERLVERTVADVGLVVQRLDAQVDALEKDADQRPADAVLAQIADIRRGCLALRRHVSPQYDALMDIARLAPGWLDAAHREEIRETRDQLHHYLEDIAATQESAVLLQDELNNRAAAQTNRTSYLLTIVAAIFLPLSFLTSLLGMDVGGTPGVGVKDGFWITCGVMAVMVTVQLVIFRRLRWI